jgi:signal transduction histidine kinase
MRPSLTSALPWGRRAAPAALALLTFAVGLAATVLLAVVVVGQQRAREGQELDRRVEAMRSTLDAELRRYRDLGAATAGMVAAAPDLTRADWERYVDGMEIAERFPGASGVSYLVPVDAAGVDALRARLDAGDPAVRAGGGRRGADDHFVLVASRRADGNPPTLGLDAADAPEPTAALRRARDTGSASLSPAYVLLSDRGLPPEQREHSLLIATPVYEGGVAPPTVATRRAALEGWATVTFRAPGLLAEALEDHSDGLLVELVDGVAETGEAPPRRVALLEDGIVDADVEALDLDSPLLRTAEVAFDGRVLTLRTLPLPQLLGETRDGTAMVALVAGAVASGLLAALVGALVAGRRRAEAAVRRTTASLAATIGQLEQRNEELAAAAARTAAVAVSQRDFVVSASHDLRTPLTSILGYLELVLDYGGRLSDEQRAHLESARAAGRRLLALVGDLLTLNRLDTDNLPLDPAPVRVGELLEDAAARAGAAAAGLDLTVEVADPLPMVWSDRQRMDQVLDHLLANAVAFTPPGGRVRLAARAEGDAVVLEVADSGVGIAPADLPHVAERFHRAGEPVGDGAKGTGLGLAVAQALVAAHDGTLAVASTVGEGTTVTVTLPALRERDRWLASTSAAADA